MGYTVLNDIQLQTDYRAKELKINDYNSVMAQLGLFLNTLKDNVDYINNNGVGAGGGEVVVVSDIQPPTGATVWLDTSNNDTHFTGTDYIETTNTDDLYEVNTDYDDAGNYIGG